jgi:AhpD family alkylhydroperoxidase
MDFDHRRKKCNFPQDLQFKTKPQLAVDLLQEISRQNTVPFRYVSADSIYGKMDEKIKELIAVGASVAAHCRPCLQFHVDKAMELGIGKDEIAEAVAVGKMVQKGGMVAMRCFTGVCGPNVDSRLVAFAGALKQIASMGVTVERFNLAQQPQAFVETFSGRCPILFYHELCFSLLSFFPDSNISNFILILLNF